MFSTTEYQLKETRQSDNRKPAGLPNEEDLERLWTFLNEDVSSKDKLKEDHCEHYMAIALAEIKSVKQELKDDIGTVDTRVSKLSDKINVLKNEIVNIREEQGTDSKNEVEKLKENITKMDADRAKKKKMPTEK